LIAGGRADGSGSSRRNSGSIMGRCMVQLGWLAVVAQCYLSKIIYDTTPPIARTVTIESEWLSTAASGIYGAMAIRVLETRRFIVNLRTRMPFRYGIATLTAVPHMFLLAEIEVDGKTFTGMAADHLPPKWFTKDPDSPVAQDIARMLHVIETACDVARAAAPSRTVFSLWRQIYKGQSTWAGGWGIPPLLAHFGTSLIERAVIDAVCRAWGITFSQAIRENRLGIALGDLHPELEHAAPSQLLPERPLRSVVARHTVGLTDPLADSDVPQAEKLSDGLPQSLQSCIREYGLTHFKVKLWGDVPRDLERVRQVADVIEREAAAAGVAYAFTLDGNENFKEVDSFRQFWSELTADTVLAGFLRHLIFVEQPLHRSVAMDSAALALAQWHDRPPIIIDESDGEVDTASRALQMGYAGTSHKNCKGVIKSIANACLLEHYREREPERAFIQSGEDLSNIGPVALQQDLCVAANLGITHIERNGHHYFHGLGAFPADLQAAVLRGHPDLFRRHEKGFVTPRISAGRMEIATVVDNGLGLNFSFDPSRFMPADQWTFESLAHG